MKKHAVLMILILLLNHFILTIQNFSKNAKKLHLHNIKIYIFIKLF